MSQSNYKGLLQIHCQKAKVVLPSYSCTQRMQGCSPVFLANLSVFGQNFNSEAEFSSKKQAEQNAAKVALRELGLLVSDEPNLQQADNKQPLLAADGACDSQGQFCAASNPVSTSRTGESLEDRQPTSTSPAEAGEESVPRVAQSPAPTASKVSLSFKNVLQEKAQKMGVALPQYETTTEGPGFVCTMTFNGQQFKSEGISSNKKQAQQSAASVAIKLLNLEQGTEGNSLIQKTDSPEIQNPAITPEKFDNKLSYKNLFQENCQQRGNKPPVYSTSWNGN